MHTVKWSGKYKIKLLYTMRRRETSNYRTKQEVEYRIKREFLHELLLDREEVKDVPDEESPEDFKVGIEYVEGRQQNRSQ